jgi:polar amino acid transport system substrate-binding protein
VVAAFLAVVVLPLVYATSASSATLDRIRATSKITFGYRDDAQPFSYRSQSGAPTGYSVALCQKIADQVKAELGLSSLTVEWAPVTLADRFNAVQQGKIDMLCGADSATLERRKQISFSIPIFPSGIGAMLRADAPAQLRQVLAEGRPSSRPVWRGDPARTVLEKKTFSALTGTTSATWLAGRLNEFQLDANVVPVASYDEGIKRVLDRSSDVLFGDFPILLDASKRSGSARDLMVIDRLFTYEPLALVLTRGDEDIRLVVDRTLSRLFRSAEFGEMFATWFGRPGESSAIFFKLSALPE